MASYGKLPAQKKEQDEAKQVKPVQMHDTTDPKFIAFGRFSHIQVGKLYAEKEDPTKAFKFIEMKEATGVFHHRPFLVSQRSKKWSI